MSAQLNREVLSDAYTYGFYGYYASRSVNAPTDDSKPRLTVTYALPDAPNPVTNVVATPGDGRATVSWAAPAADATHDPADSYLVACYLISGTPCANLSRSTTSRTLTYSGLTNGQEVYFLVTARNGGGSADSSRSNNVTPHPAPEPPPNLRLYAGDRQVGAVWDEPEAHGASVEAYYVYLVRSDTGSTVASREVVDRRVGFKELTNGVLYHVDVYARSQVGWGRPATSPSVTPSPGAGHPPSSPTQVLAAGDSMYVGVDWSPPGDLGNPPLDDYVVSLFRVDGQSRTTIGTRVTASTHAGYSDLQVGASYQWSVAARSGLAASEPSYSDTIVLAEPQEPDLAGAYASPADQAAAEWQMANDTSGIEEAITDELTLDRDAGGYYDDRGEDKRIVTMIKAVTDDDRRRLQDRLGSKFDLLRIVDVTYSWNELAAVSNQVDALRRDHPDGASVSGIYTNPASNQVVMISDGSSPTLETLAMAAVPEDSLVIQRGKIEIQPEDSRFQGAPPWKGGKHGYTIDRDFDEGACSAGLVWESGDQILGSTAGHCLTNDARWYLGNGRNTEFYGYGERNGYRGREGAVNNDTVMVRGRPGTTYTPNLIFIDGETHIKVVGFRAKQTRPGAMVCHSGWKTNVQCGPVDRVDQKGPELPNGAYYTEVTCADHYSDFGDSGAPVFTRLPRNRAQAFGMHIAGFYESDENGNRRHVGACFHDISTIARESGVRLLTR